MNPLVTIASESKSLEELGQRLGELLRLGGPIPPGALHRLLADTEYLHQVLRNRGDLSALRQVLADPANDAFLPAEAEGEVGAGELLGRVTQAFLRWAQTGFRTADAATIERRLAACRRCDQYGPPPAGAIYRLAQALGERGAVCAQCGCFVERKVRLPDEACPLQHPDRPGENRWSEPYREETAR